MKRQQIIFSIFIILIITLLVISPTENIEATLNGLVVWATALLPALFPFFVFTRLLNELKLIEVISNFLAPVTQKLYNAPGISAYVYVMSILSGYPVGAKITSDLYEKGVITYGQACRITTFTSTSGPLFILGTVGIGMFASKTMGLTILACHFLGALVNGLLYRKYNLKNENLSIKTYSLPKSTGNMLEEVMYSSIKSILIIGGYIAIFFMLITMFNNYGILTPFNNVIAYVFGLLKLDPQVVPSITNGIIEITKGCLDLSVVSSNIRLNTIVATGIITFGGFSIHMQALTFLKKFNIKTTFYLLQKTTHTVIAVVFAVLFTSL